MDMDASPCTVAIAELNDRKSAGLQSQSLGSRRALESPPSPFSSLEPVKNDAFGPPLGPATPDSNRESVDYHLDSTSPLSLRSPPTPEGLCFTSHHKDRHHHSLNKYSPCTPRKDVFDPFAPGPDSLMLAPYRRRYAHESCLSGARRLEFNSSSKFAVNTDGETHDKVYIPEEEMLLQAMYLTILEAVISMQTEDIAKVSELLPDSGGFKTPTSAPRLSGVADTCPPAPVKPSNKLRSIDKEICRRLEF